MADENLNIDITARDDASKVIDAVQKKTDKLEKSEPEVVLGADDNASKPIDAVQKKVDKLDGEEATVAVDADTKSASSDIDTFAKKLGKLSAEDQVVLLTLKAGAAQSELTQLATDIALLDQSDPEVEIKLERYAEVSSDLDDLKAKITDIGNAPIDQGGLGGNLDGVKDKLGGLRDEADRTKDSVHSMAGNAIGDFAATATGVGPLGEAIGQLTEIAAGGEASLKQLAIAGLGLGAISAGILILNTIMGKFADASRKAAENKAFNDKVIKDYTAAILAAKAALDEYNGVKVEDPIPHGTNANMQDLAAKTNELVGAWKKAGKIEVFDPKTNGVVDITHALAQAGISAEEYAHAIIEGGQASNVLSAKAAKAGLSTDKVRLITRTAAGEYVKYRSAMADAADQAAVFGDGTEDAGASQAALNAETQRWNAIAAANGIQLGASSEQLKAYTDTLKSTDFGATELSAATTAMSAFTDQHFALTNIAADTEEAFDNLSESVKTNGKTFDVTTDKGRANQKALQDVAHVLDTQFAAAYDDANGNLDTFKEKSKVIAEQTLTRLQKELGLSDDETADLAASLGLLPEDIETRYKLSGDEEAKQKIGLLQTSIDNLPKDVQAKVTQQIIVGDYQGALATVQGYYNTHGAEVPTTVENPSTADMALTGKYIKDYYGSHKVPISAIVLPGYAGGGTVGSGGGIGGERGPELIRTPNGRTSITSGATYLPPGTQVTSTKRTKAILRSNRSPRRLRNYANGTASPVPMTSGVPPVVFQYNQNAPVYGVDDLNRHLAAWANQLAQKISVGRR